MEVLSAYVREHAPRSMCFSAAPTAHLTTDVQAILTVIGQRDKNRNALALSGTCLANANLAGANLTNADLFGVKQFKRRDDRRAVAVLTC